MLTLKLFEEKRVKILLSQIVASLIRAHLFILSNAGKYHSIDSCEFAMWFHKSDSDALIIFLRILKRKSLNLLLTFTQLRKHMVMLV